MKLGVTSTMKATTEVNKLDISINDTEKSEKKC